MDPKTVNALFPEAAAALNAHYADNFRQWLSQTGIEGNQWFVLAVAHDLQPSAASVAQFELRWPYAADAVYGESLTQLAEKGYLEDASEGQYYLTERGRSIVAEAHELLGRELADLEPQPVADLERLELLLRRIVDTALVAPEPELKTCLVSNRNSDPGPDSPTLFRILQRLADLNAFRDDAHLAAWRLYDVSGPAWEALTLVWRDEGRTAKELAELLPHRGIDADGYAEALESLVEKSWLTRDAEVYKLTDTGRVIREDAEGLTDRFYFAAWRGLTDNELQELGDRLTDLRDRLRESAPEPAETPNA